ncbi:MAG: M15 family metallopeptidase [Proteobacteria bacterium]|nr:M15 family metallopeptidase [Pseudomonadota bacterium]
MRSLSAGKLIFSSVAIFSLVAVAYYVSSSYYAGDTVEESVSLLESKAHKTQVVDGQSKVVSPLSLKEYVMIGAQRFEVLEPWRGHRIGSGQGVDGLEFAMLPVELTFENRKIYVTPETRNAFVEMARAAALDGVILLVDSGYRSPAYQRKIYQRKMQEGDDFYAIAHGVAPPGYSEHMLGTTLDLVPSKWTFNNTPADKWLQENGARFSFSQSYPEKTEFGFAWEPWHWKYIGGN